MNRKKIRTEHCLSPDSLFMRKPSKQFLKRVTFNRGRGKQSNKNMVDSSQHFGQQNPNKIAFIRITSSQNSPRQKNLPSKQQKTPIQLVTVKIKYENMKLKSQMQKIVRKNSQLIEQNKTLKELNQGLKQGSEIPIDSKISKFSQETLEYTDADDLKKSRQFINFGSHESLEMDSYQIPTTSQILQTKSVIIEQEPKYQQDDHYLSSSLSRKIKPSPFQLKFKEEFPHKLQLQILSNRISYLEKQLRNAIVRQRSLQHQNQSLRLCASMSKRKLEHKESQLKQIKIKEKKKKYFEKFFELSSEDDN